MTPVSTRLNVRFPAADGNGTTQDREWCEVVDGAVAQRIRFHDYHEIYTVPGLYERIFYEHLQCNSPQVVIGLLREHVEKAGQDPSQLSGIDVGAGNGMVGEEMRNFGVGALVGVDIIPEAAEAAERDRPEVYDEYVVCDLTQMTEEDRERLCALRPNLLSCVAALGFDDIPPAAFAAAYNLIEDGGWVAFNIKADFLDRADESGFRQLVAEMLEGDAFDECARRRYVHRLAVHGEPLHYQAIVGRKRRDVSSA